MEILEATSADEIRACHPVAGQLRDHLTEQAFVDRVQRQRGDGYRLVYLQDDGRVVSVAGFRILEMLSRGRFLYVDDLVTREDARGAGYGTRLLDWLVEHARDRGCERIDLDSGFNRKRAHRFYLARGMELASLHFCKSVE